MMKCRKCHEAIVEEDQYWYIPGRLNPSKDYIVVCAGVPKGHPNWVPYPSYTHLPTNYHQPFDPFLRLAYLTLHPEDGTV